MVAETYIHVVLVAYFASNGYNLVYAIIGVIISYLSASFIMIFIISKDINLKFLNSRI